MIQGSCVSSDFNAEVMADGYRFTSVTRRMKRFLERGSLDHSVMPSPEHLTRIGSKANAASRADFNGTIAPDVVTVSPAACKNPAVHHM